MTAITDSSDQSDPFRNRTSCRTRIATGTPVAAWRLGIIHASGRLGGLLAVLAALGNATCFAEVFIEHVDPPSLQRGETTRVSLVGSGLQHEIGLWTSCERGWINARQVGENESGIAIFDVKVSSDAQLGLYGLRLATRGGLSNAHLFLIDDLVSHVENERQNGSNGREKFESAQRVALPAAVMGICREVDVDTYLISVTAGQTVTFEVVGSRLGKAFDPLVSVRDRRGRIVIQHDNDIGLFFDCRFRHEFQEAGDYLVELRDSRFKGSDHWTYVLRMGNFPVARVALPSAVRPGEKVSLVFPQMGDRRFSFMAPKQTDRNVISFVLREEGDDASAWMPLLLSDLAATMEREPNDEPDAPTVAAVPGMLHGMFSRRADRDWFAFDLKKGQTLNMRTDTRTFGSPADVELVLFDLNGKEVKRADESGFDDASLSYTAKLAGRYSLLVRELLSWGGPEFVYRIEVRGREPRLELSSGITRMTVPQGTNQPLPLTLKRTDFRGGVRLSLAGAPPGVRLTRFTIEADDSEVDNAILVDEQARTGIYSVQVIARDLESEKLMAVGRTRPLVDRLPTGRGPHGEPFELREDQRRLPVTLTDRIALLITEPAPFDFKILPDFPDGDAQQTPPPTTAPVVTLPRYLGASFTIKTTRKHGFAGPITFVARGGELEQDRLRAPRVGVDLPNATMSQPVVTAVLQSQVQTKLVKHRVTVTGTVEQNGRHISLTRVFNLHIRIAFEPRVVPNRIEIRYGKTAKLRIHAGRIPPFVGPVSVTLEQVNGLILPESVTIPAGHDSIEVQVQAAADAKPKKYSIALSASARVGKFRETSKGQPLEVVVMKDE